MDIACVAVAGMAAGIIGARAAGVWFALAGAVALAISRRSNPVRVFSLAVLSGALILTAHAAWLGQPATDGHVEITGTLLRFEQAESSRMWTIRPATGGYRGLVRVEEYAGRGESLPPPSAYPGDLVSVSGQARLPSGPTNPGESDRRGALQAARIHLLLRLDRGAGVSRLGAAGGIEAGMARVRARVRDAVMRAVPGSPGALLMALISGDRSGLTRAESDALARTGLSHVTAVSGFHVGLVAGVGRALPGKGAWRALLILVYVAFVGLRPSVTRAAFMALAALAGASRGRGMGGLSAAVIAVLALNPYALSDPGFQLSVSATWGILLGVRTSGEGPVTGLVRTAVWAQLGSFPVAAWHFGTFSLVGLPLTAVAVPLAAAATVTGIAGAALVWSIAGRAVLAVAGIPARMLLHLAVVCSGWRAAAITLPRPPVSLIAGWFLLVWAWRKAPGRVRTCAVWCALALALLACPIRRPLQIVLFDVGNGDAILVRSPRGSAVLIDTGHEGRVGRLLPRIGVNRIAAVILTHSHSDHTGGMADVARTARIGAVLHNGSVDVGPYRSDAVVRVLSAGQSFEIDGVSFSVVHPPRVWPGPDVGENDRSLVLMVEYGEFRALLCGDIEGEGESLLSGRTDLNAYLLKVAHHGGDTSTSDQFVQDVSPVLAVISTGPNRHGHPSAEVIKRLSEAGAMVLRTDQGGAVIVSTNGRGKVRVRRGG